MANQKLYSIKSISNYLSIGVFDMIIDPETEKKYNQLIDIIDLPLNGLRINTTTGQVNFSDGEIRSSAQSDTTTRFEEEQRANSNLASENIQRLQLSFITNNANALNLNRYTQIEDEFQKAIFQVDENGELILDEKGKPIQQTDSEGKPLFEIVKVVREVPNQIEIKGEIYSFEEAFLMLCSMTGFTMFAPVQSDRQIAIPAEA
jgi:hypothetical protein